MEYFRIDGQVQSDIDKLADAQKELRAQIQLVGSVKSTLQTMSSYDSLCQTLFQMQQRLEKEGKDLQTYGEKLQTIYGMYQGAERRITGDVALLKSNGVIIVEYTNEQKLENFFKALGGFFASVLKFFGIYDWWRKKYEAFIEEIRRILNNGNSGNGGDSGNGGGTEPPAPEPPAPEPPAPEPPAPEPPAPEPPKPEPPAPEPPKPDPGPNRDPNYGNTLYDGQGMYGARQRLPKNQEIYGIIRMFYPDWSDAQCNRLIDRLGPEGCAYSGMANIILKAYTGQAELFEQTYGFSMYKNGDLNYDELVMYCYTAYDDPNMGGIAPGHMDDYLRDMLAMGGKSIDTEFFYEPDWNNIPNDVQNGTLAFSTQGSFDIYTLSGQKMHFDEAHYMTVTGITDDGMLIVSTWGGKYKINPNTAVGGYYTYFKTN